MQSSTNSEYSIALPKWKRCRDAVEGQDAIHRGQTEYLPKLDDQTDAQYEAYVQRARFFNASSRTIDALTGLVSRKEAYIEPEDNFTDNVDGKGTDINDYALNVVKESLIVGRSGTLVDYSPVDETMTVAMAESLNVGVRWGYYVAEAILDWTFAMSNNKYQLTWLLLFDGVEVISTSAKIYHFRECVINDGVYQQNRYTSKTFDGEMELVSSVVPKIQNKTFNNIPFFFHQATDDRHVAKPPILDLVNTNISHYRLKADQYHALHYVALPTPYITGVDSTDDDAPSSIGSAKLWLIGNDAAKVGMLEFSGAGLDSIKEELESCESQMSQQGARMLAPEQTSSNVETATASGIRQVGETSALAELVKAVSRDIKNMYALTLTWLGRSSDNSAFQLNSDFLPTKLSGADLLALVQSWQNGAYSKEVLFYNLKQGEIIPDEVEFDDEEKRIQDESENIGKVTDPDMSGAVTD